MATLLHMRPQKDASRRPVMVVAGVSHELADLGQVHGMMEDFFMAYEPEFSADGTITLRPIGRPVDATKGPHCTRGMDADQIILSM